jgi:hypothetical protein
MHEYEEFSELEYMVSIEGFIVPIAHIKAIGWVEETTGDYEGVEDRRFFFRVYLDQPISMQDDPATRDLAAFYDTDVEARQARSDLAERVNDYYKQMVQGLMFPGSIQ